MHADAEEAYRTGRGIRAIQQPDGALRDVFAVARRRRLRVAACEGREVRVAHLDRDGAAEQLLLVQPLRRVARHLVDRLADLVDVGQVLRVGALAA